MPGAIAWLDAAHSPQLLAIQFGPRSSRYNLNLRRHPMEPDLRYPIGKFEAVTSLTPDQRRQCIDVIADAPGRLAAAVAGLTPAQLDTPYRPEGWTVRQLVHHIADSHMNAVIRFKLTLTEDEPTVKT